MGLHRAGFDVIGVDIEPQPRYPFRFVQADALKFDIRAAGAAFVWASPPCQAHTAMRVMHNAKKHADLIPATRELLRKSGLPYCIENVVGAPLLNPVTLCGTMFGLGAHGCDLRRERWFETSFPLAAPPCNHGAKPVIGIYGGHARKRSAKHGGRGTRDAWPLGHKEAASTALGIDWMTLTELSQAIPPAYSEFVGRAALRCMMEIAA